MIWIYTVWKGRVYLASAGLGLTGWIKLFYSMDRSTHTAGIPCICIGVGWWIPFFFSPCKTGFGNFISLKVLIGGGLSIPSTSMCHFLRTFSCLDSGISKIYPGGRHLLTRYMYHQYFYRQQWYHIYPNHLLTILFLKPMVFLNDHFTILYFP